MVMYNERDFPIGHPSSGDYDPESAEAKEWIRRNVHPMGERDFPVDHPKALDTPGNQNHIQNIAGIDPARPDHEQFTGRSPKQAEAVRKIMAARTAQAKESPVPVPMEAPKPPAPGSIALPTGQPGKARTRPKHK